MSASTIARWNAIPMDRDTFKRPRAEDEQNVDDDDDDDDVSLVSRSPSPSHAPMDVDPDHISKYDEYARGTPREVITVDTKIKSTNKGFAMLAKLGWVEGQPLGLSGEGRVDPIPFHVKQDLTGLGKTSQDVRMIETTVSQRRGMDSERQQKETELQRREREDKVARKAALETEISSVLRAFYCTLCDKQFKNVAQYDEHTNSYAHHHKARFKDMQANVRVKPKEEVDKRKEKERRREEKELRKIAAAAGIKMPKPANALAQPVASTSAIQEDIDGEPLPNPPAQQPSTGFKKSGWSSLAPVAPVPAVTPPPPPPPVPSSLPPPPPRPSSSQPAPSFRTAGWATLDAGDAMVVDTPQPPVVAPPPPPDPQRGGWAAAMPAAPLVTPAPPPAPKASSQTQGNRSNWQQFQKSKAPRRK
ncbi:hypothetical protein BDN72DRAFT_830035 [Pluteus cervinus]|uniref:Uncharacterized protein n=1 Tax=Pluteus cervinus TaxID=181527 RepID=A0ACD3BG53_9AGAR|nr:hypothetical protein BDN72DRAFT_830035 [Pluteus cervinus]